MIRESYLPTPLISGTPMLCINNEAHLNPSYSHQLILDHIYILTDPDLGGQTRHFIDYPVRWNLGRFDYVNG